MNAQVRTTARRIGRGARVGAGLTVAVAATLALSGAAPAVEPQATGSAVRDGSLSAAPEPSASPTPSPSRTRTPRVTVDDEDLLPPDAEDAAPGPRADRSPRAGTSPRSGKSATKGKSSAKGRSTTGRTPTRGTAQRGSTPTSTARPTASPTATPAPTSSPSPTASPTASPTPTPTPTASPTPTPTPTTPAPTPTPTPTPTPGPVVLPGGVSGLPFGVCGSLVAEAPANPTVGRDTLAFAFTAAIPAPAPTTPSTAPAETPTPAATTTATASDTPTPTPTPTPPPTVLAGQPLTLTTDYRWTLPQHRLRSLLPEQGARVAVSTGGVVVATGYLDDGTGVPRTDQRRVLSNQQLTGTLPLTVCAPDGAPGDVTAGRDLPAGDYEVHAVLDYLGVPFAFPDPLGADPLEGQPAGDLVADPAAWRAPLVSTTSVRFTIS